jgi:hypothetical protein
VIALWSLEILLIGMIEYVPMTNVILTKDDRALCLTFHDISKRIVWEWNSWGRPSFVWKDMAQVLATLLSAGWSEQYRGKWKGDHGKKCMLIHFVNVVQ